MKNGDILLLSDGRLLRVEKCGIACYTSVLYIDKEEISHVDTDNLLISDNLGQSSAILATFYAARSVHLRLNGFNRI